MPQNATDTPQTLGDAGGELPAGKPSRQLGGRSAVAAARAARRARLIRLAPHKAMPDSVAAAEPPVPSAPPEGVPSPPPETAAQPTEAAPSRPRRWRATRRRAATEPAASSAAALPESSPVGSEPEAVADADSLLATAADPGLSVFEHLVRGGTAPPPADPAPDAAPDLEPAARLASDLPTHEAAQAAPIEEPTPVVAASDDPGIIAELGPGLRLRLRQLGYGTDTALAVADPNQLRQGLGEISRMLNVEAWIEAARRRASASAPSEADDHG